MKLHDLLTEIERLDKFLSNFANADRIELAIWKKNNLDVMNFDPKKAFNRTALPLLAQYVRKYREVLNKASNLEEPICPGVHPREFCSNCDVTESIKETLEWTPEEKEISE